MKVHPFNFLVSFQVYYSEGLLLRFLLNEIYQNFNSETTINEKKNEINRKNNVFSPKGEYFVTSSVHSYCHP